MLHVTNFDFSTWYFLSLTLPSPPSLPSFSPPFLLSSFCPPPLPSSPSFLEPNPPPPSSKILTTQLYFWDPSLCTKFILNFGLSLYQPGSLQIFKLKQSTCWANSCKRWMRTHLFMIEEIFTFKYLNSYLATANIKSQLNLAKAIFHAILRHASQAYHSNLSPTRLLTASEMKEEMKNDHYY